MPLVAQVAALIAAAIHVWFFVLESLLFRRPAVAARFGVRTPEQIAAVRPVNLRPDLAAVDNPFLSAADLLHVQHRLRC